MSIEDQLRERLKKVEALYFGATTTGERGAAEAEAAERRFTVPPSSCSSVRIKPNSLDWTATRGVT